MVMSNSHFPLKIEADAIKLVGENENVETIYTVAIEHIHSDTFNEVLGSVIADIGSGEILELEELNDLDIEVSKCPTI